MMRLLESKPWLIAFLVTLLLFVLFVFVPLPLFDGVLIYQNGLVHAEVEEKIALSHLFGNGLKGLEWNGSYPAEIHLKPIGWTLLLIIHLGFPLLLGLRLKFGRSRKELEKRPNE